MNSLSGIPMIRALSIAALSDALQSNEPNVRIAAVHAMAQVSKPSREARIDALDK